MDIGYCGLFLASDESDYITGQEFLVDRVLLTKARLSFLASELAPIA
jgi:hypothetical protein